MQDVKQALRMFRQSPAFTATAVLALTIGIGANTAVFSVVNAVILKPVPFPEPDRLVQLVTTGNGGPSSAGSPTRYVHWRRQTDVLEDVAAYRNLSMSYRGGDVPERVAASRVTAAYFRAFRAPIERGRPFTAREDSPGAAKTAVVSHDFWVRRLGGDPAIIGEALSLSGVPHTVVGIMAPEFDTRELGRIEVWVPYQIDPSTSDQGQYFRVAARLKPGVSLEQAQARLAASTAAYRERFPVDLRPGRAFGAVPFQDAVVGTASNDPLGTGTRTMLWTLLGAVGLVLLIACANVAGLMLVRAGARSREIAIRSALGAGRWRIVRQLATEGALLSAVGGVLGLILGSIGIRALLATDTAGLPRLGGDGTLLGLDWRVVGFTVAVSLVTGMLFSLAPALAVSRPDLDTVIKHASSRQGAGFRLGRSRSLLIVAEVGLAVVLLIGAALLIRTLLALNRVDPGFAVDNVLVMRTPLDEPRFEPPGVVDELAASTLERIRAIPGVEAASASSWVPLTPGAGLVFNVVGRDDEGPFTGGGSLSISTGGYFETFEMPVVRGRVFDERDDADGAPVVVINRALADRWWPEDAQDPLRDRMVVGGGGALYPELADEPARRIIGIVEDARVLSLSSDRRPTMYLPLGQFFDAWRAPDAADERLSWIVRTRNDPMQLAATVRAEIRQATGVPVTDVRTMADVVSASLSRERLNVLLMTVFGAAALLLAAIGLFGLMTYSVQQRTHEIGIRMALGASQGRVRRMVIRQGMLLVAIGMAVGLTAAFFVSDLLAAVLFGVQPRDAAVFAGVPAVLTLVAAAAVSTPAIRASRVDALDALRHQ